MADLPEGFTLIAEGPAIEATPAPLPDGFTVIAEGPPLDVNQSFVPDWLKQLGSGMVEGTAGTIGMAGDAVQLMTNPGVAFLQEGGPLASMQTMTEAVQPMIAADDGSLARTIGEYVGPDALFSGGLMSLGKIGLGKAVRSLGPTLAGALGEYTGEKVAPDSPATQAALAMGGALTAAGVDEAAARLLRPKPPQMDKAVDVIARNQLRGVTDVDGNQLPGLVDADRTHAGLKQYVDNPPEGLESFRSTAEVLDDPDWAKLEIENASASTDRVYAKASARAGERDKMLNELIPEATKSPSQEGEILMGVAAREKNQLDDKVQLAYGTLDPDHSTRIPIARQKGVLKKTIAKRFGSGADKPHPALQELIDDFDNAPDLHIAAREGDEGTAQNFKTLDWLENMRRRSYDVADMLAVKRPKQAEVAQRIAALTDEAQEQAIKSGRGLTNTQRKQLVDARALRRELGETFQQKEMKKILGEGKYGEQMMDESKVADAILSKGPEAIDRFKKAVGRDKKAINTLRRAMLDRIQRDSKDKLTPHKFNQTFMRKNAESIDRLFSPTHKKNLQRIADDLASEAGVAEKAFLSAKGNSPTQVRQAYSANKNALFDAALSMSGAGPAGAIIRRALKSQAKGADESMIALQKFVDKRLLEAALDPKVAYDLTRPLPKEPGVAKKVISSIFKAIFEVPGSVLANQPGVAASVTQSNLIEPVMENGQGGNDAKKP